MKQSGKVFLSTLGAWLILDIGTVLKYGLLKGEFLCSVVYPMGACLILATYILYLEFKSRRPK